MKNEFVERSSRDFETIDKLLNSNGSNREEKVRGQLELLDAAFTYQFKSDQAQVLRALAYSGKVKHVISQLREIPALEDQAERLIRHVADSSKLGKVFVELCKEGSFKSAHQLFEIAFMDLNRFVRNPFLSLALKPILSGELESDTDLPFEEIQAQQELVDVLLFSISQDKDLMRGLFSNVDADGVLQLATDCADSGRLQPECTLSFARSIATIRSTDLGLEPPSTPSAGR